MRNRRCWLIRNDVSGVVEPQISGSSGGGGDDVNSLSNDRHICRGSMESKVVVSIIYKERYVLFGFVVVVVDGVGEDKFNALDYRIVVHKSEGGR